MFFRHLSESRLIRDSFVLASNSAPWGDFDRTNLSQAYPAAALGTGYVVVFSADGGNNRYGQNYFGIFGISAAYHSGYNIGLGQVISQANIPVKSANQLDVKIDDGLPRSGKVRARKPETDNFFGVMPYVNTASESVAQAGSTSTCFDNNSNVGQAAIYSLRFNSGNGTNCSLVINW